MVKALYLRLISKKESNLPETKQIIHIHALRPPLLRPYLLLIFQMRNHFCFSWKSPNQTTSIWRGINFRWSNFYNSTMNLSCSFVYQRSQRFYIFINMRIVIIFTCSNKSIIEKYMSCKRCNQKQKFLIKKPTF